MADGFSACSHALCNKRFYACKDRYYDEVRRISPSTTRRPMADLRLASLPTPHAQAETFATYLDCSCRCSDDEGPEGAVPRRFASRGAARCTVAECDRQGFCEGGTASADFTGVPDLDFVLLVAPGAEAEAEETPEPNCQCACCAQAARIGPSASLVCEAPEGVDRVTNALGLAKLLTRVGKPSECVPEICASRFPAACPGPAAVANGSAFAFATYDWEGEGFPHGGD